MDKDHPFFKAVHMATIGHHAQRRKSSNNPYIIHPLRVAYLAIDAGLSDEACIAAVLHDLVEDCEVDISEIYSNFPYRVGQIVSRLSKWWPDSATKEEKATNKAEYYARILEDQEAINIKVLDRIDNLRDMFLLLPQEARWAKKYLKKTEEEIYVLYEKCDNEAIRELYRVTIKEFKEKLGAK